MTTKERVATVTGTWLAPGVSKNNRLYTKENIAKAVARMQSAITDGHAPAISQLTSHGTDDVLQTVGRFDRVWQTADGLAKYESAVPDTANGQDMATLTKHGYVRNVSISGSWVGDVETKEVDGIEVETAPDLEVFRVDYVPRPGVGAARIDHVAMAEGGTLGNFRDDFLGPVSFIKSCPTCGHSEAEPVTPAIQETIVTEAQTTETKGGLSDADIAKIGAAIASPVAEAIKEAMKPIEPAKPAETAPVATPPVTTTTETTTETPPASAETEEQRFARFFEAKKAELVTEIVKERGLPTRTGVVTPEGGPSKPLHEMGINSPEFKAIARESAFRTLPGIPGLPGYTAPTEG